MSRRRLHFHTASHLVQVGPPAVILRIDEDGKKQEPFDEATVDVPEEYVGACVDLLGSRKGAMLDMNTINVRAPLLATSTAHTSSPRATFALRPFLTSTFLPVSVWVLGIRAPVRQTWHAITQMLRARASDSFMPVGGDIRRLVCSIAAACVFASTTPARCMASGGFCVGCLRRRKCLARQFLRLEAQGQSRVTYEIPTRGLLGLKSAILTSTKGTAVLNTRFVRYGPYEGELSTRELGSLVAFETGEVTAYALATAQERGVLYCRPGESVYEGQIVGVHQRAGDLRINVCKKKALTNMRASGKDHTVALDSARDMSLDNWCAPPLRAAGSELLAFQLPRHAVLSAATLLLVTAAGALERALDAPQLARSLEYIVGDELVEVTPVSVRMRKLPDSKKQRR